MLPLLVQAENCSAHFTCGLFWRQKLIAASHRGTQSDATGTHVPPGTLADSPRGCQMEMG